jgi:hypothetical protein
MKRRNVCPSAASKAGPVLITYVRAEARTLLKNVPQGLKASLGQI